MTGAEILAQVREALYRQRIEHEGRDSESDPIEDDLDGCILLTREEAAQLRAALRMTPTVYAEPARALLTPEPTKEDA